MGINTVVCYDAGMTTLLQQAIAKVQSLAPTEQDAIAQVILEEIESDRLWEAALARSPEKLARLGEAAWMEHESGKTEPLDLDNV